MKLTREEQETVIRCSAADQDWDIYTADPRMIRYLEKRGYHAQPDKQFSDPYKAFKVPFLRLRFLTREKRPAPPSENLAKARRQKLALVS